MTEVVVPNVGESVSSGILAQWIKKDGEYVNDGENLFELETDKATLEVPSTVSGRLKTSVAEGDEVEVGSVVATIDESVAAGSSLATTDAVLAGTDVGQAEGASETVQAAVSSFPTPIPATVSIEVASGTKSVAKSLSPPSSATVIKRSLGDLSPALRRLVEELGLDPSVIPASDKSGRLTKEDVRNFVHKGLQSSGEAVKKRVPLVGDINLQRQRRVPMTNLRKRIAEKLVESKQNAAHLTTFNEVDMSAVMDIRKAYKESFEKKHQVRLGFMSFFLKAAVKALKSYP